LCYSCAQFVVGAVIDAAAVAADDDEIDKRRSMEQRQMSETFFPVT